MHELPILQNIVDIVLEEARRANVDRVTDINIAVGELSGVVPESMQFYFDYLKKDDIIAQARLHFNIIPTEVTCRDCHTKFTPVEGQWACPNCESKNLDVVSGTGSYVESIEVA